MKEVEPASDGMETRGKIALCCGWDERLVGRSEG